MRISVKNQEITIYREVQRNTEMAIKAIDAISDKVYDDQLASQISRQSLKYSQLHNQAMKQLVAAKAEPYHGSYVSDMMLRMGVGYNTLLNTSTSHIAEMMIKGSNNGILEMEKVLRHNQNVSEAPRSLAEELIHFEEKNVQRLKDYL